MQLKYAQSHNICEAIYAINEKQYFYRLNAAITENSGRFWR